MPITNPFGTSGPSIPPPPGSSQPPSYNRATRPTPAPPSQPTTYGSLKDLTSGNAQRSQSYQYSPQPERVGYKPQVEQTSPFGPSGGHGRAIPPPPSNYGKEITPEPPRRNVPVAAHEDTRTTPVAPGQAGWRGAAATAGSYVPNSVSATATSVADRAKDGFDSVFTQERKGQVMAGAGKAAAGAAKLTAKAAWSLGKFASSR